MPETLTPLSQIPPRRASLDDADVRRIAGDMRISETAVRQVAEAFDRATARANPLDAVHPRAGEIQKWMLEKGPDAYREAYTARMSMSEFLDRNDYPEGFYKDGLDAYERQLRLANIRVRSVPSRGIYGDKVEMFLKGGGNIPTVKQIAGQETESRFYQSNAPASIVLFPEFINRQLRVTGQTLPSILGDLVAITTGVDSNVYHSFYLNLDTTQLSARRVTEIGDFATAELTGAEHVVRLKKYGRAIKGTYETLRRMSIDRFAFHLQQIAIQAAVDKSQSALDTLINGDGNSTTAATVYNKTALQGGSGSDALTVAGWLAFNLKFRDPYHITTIIGTDANIITLLTLNMGTFNIPFAQFQNLQAGLGGGFALGEPINGGPAPIRLYARSFAPTNSLVAIDNTRALEMLVEVGADIVETDKIIRNQTAEIIISEVVGFANLDTLANKVLTLNA